MKKLFIIFTLLLFLTNSIYSQDFYFGVSSGMVKSVYSKTDDKKHFKDLIDATRPSANVIFSTIFKNNLELATGVTFYSYPYKILASGDNMWGNRILQTLSNQTAYFAFSVPVHLGYKIRLANRWFFNVYTGLKFDFYFNPQYSSNSKIYEDCVRYVTTEDALKQRFNILLSNKLSMQYFTKFNMGISLFVSYHSGLFQIWESTALTIYSDTHYRKSSTTSRGSYWIFGLELGYKLNKKPKTDS